MEKQLEVRVDRPVGFVHHGTVYSIPYGYVPGVIGGDGEEQDVYILGSSTKSDYYTGTLIAIVHRHDDVETKWVVNVDEKHQWTKNEIAENVDFIEKYFDSWIEMV